MPVVVGIFPNNDAIAKLAQAITSGGLDVNELTVISSENASDDLISSGVQFVLSGEPDEEMLSAGTGIITSSGGTGVPGLTDSATFPHVSHGPSTVDLLADLDVPDGRTDDYVEAIDQGRCVAGYVVSGDADKIKSIFTSAGGSPVEVF
jgi:hypothetical protein